MKKILLLISMVILVGCTQPNETSTTTGIANPASEKCIADGGTLEIRASDEGQYGICIFPDGTECDEWAYFRGECDTKDSVDDIVVDDDKDEYGCVISEGYQWCEINSKCQILWEEPCLEKPDFDSSLIKDAFSKKYPEWDLSNWEVHVARQFDKFATGGISPMEEGVGGGYFFAVNTDDGWVIVADGNGVIECQQIEPYDFPSDLIGECWDTVNNVVVER